MRLNTGRSVLTNGAGYYTFAGIAPGAYTVTPVLSYYLLPEMKSKLHVNVTEAGALDPELTTAAIVVHHPEAKYFSV